MYDDSDSMSTDEYRACLDAIGWSPRRVAVHLRIHENRPRRWATGDLPIPGNVADWLRVLAAEIGPLRLAALRRHPRPEGWTFQRPTVERVTL